MAKTTRCMPEQETKQNESVERQQKNYETEIALESKKNPQAFFGCARSKLKVKTGVSDLLDKNGIAANSDESKAGVK